MDEARGALWVSDSRGEGNPGPGIFRYDLTTGKGGVWSHEDWDFANGMCLDETRSGLYVVESFTGRVRTSRFAPMARAAPATDAVTGLGRVLDGLALAPDGTLYISCYEPGRIYRRSKDGAVAILIEDPLATVLAHPTNLALKGTGFTPRTSGAGTSPKFALTPPAVRRHGAPGRPLSPALPDPGAGLVVKQLQPRAAAVSVQADGGQACRADRDDPRPATDDQEMLQQGRITPPWQTASKLSHRRGGRDRQGNAGAEGAPAFAPRRGMGSSPQPW